MLIVAACGYAGTDATTPVTGAAFAAVDLGSSSRIPRVAGRVGEGEGYDVVAPTSATNHAAMPGMEHANHDGVPPTSPAAMDHRAHGADHSAAGSAQPTQASQAHVQGTGTVNSVDAGAHKINLSHAAIPAIGWPAMTMDFAVASSADLSGIKPGAHVDFMLQRGGDGMYVVHSIAPAGGGH
jgi:Cu/Ag efflux protein CusF